MWKNNRIKDLLLNKTMKRNKQDELNRMSEQEQKIELLLRDLCGRELYGVKVTYYDKEEDVVCVDVLRDVHPLYNQISVGFPDIKSSFNAIVPIEEVKPYLFPLSSMTEEQIYNSPFGYGTMDTIRKNKDWTIIEIGRDEYYKLTDWFNKNHFDYRGLIEKGLAIDATGKNIY